ncbi:MAG: septum formation initiator family protein [Bacteroidia bacterium]|nr:septum formation initiator family protein [Bacteroidia bacterium]
MKPAMRIPPFFKNRYFLLIAGFLLVMLFFDNNSLVRQVKLSRNLHEARTMNAFYREEIKRQEEFLKKLHSNDSFAEKLAREKYLMKRDDEDVYIIVGE